MARSRVSSDMEALRRLDRQAQARITGRVGAPRVRPDDFLTSLPKSLALASATSRLAFAFHCAPIARRKFLG